jgi:hypothetical protein
MFFFFEKKKKKLDFQPILNPKHLENIIYNLTNPSIPLNNPQNQNWSKIKKTSLAQIYHLTQGERQRKPKLNFPHRMELIAIKINLFMFKIGIKQDF